MANHFASHARIVWGSGALSNASMTADFPTIADIRRRNLAALIAEAGSQRALADAMEIAPAQISQWVTAAPNAKTGTPRTVGDESARALEVAMGKPKGWLDHWHGERGETDEPAAAAEPSLRTCLAVVLDALARLPPARAVSVRAQLDQVMGHPEMHDDTLAELLHLLALPSASPGKRTGTGG